MPSDDRVLIDYRTHDDAGVYRVGERTALVREMNNPPAPSKSTPEAPKSDANTRAAEEQLRLALGTRVRIVRRGQAGRLEIDFVNEDELNRLYEYITERR